MSTDSFDGGSHGTHHWRVAGSEKLMVPAAMESRGANIAITAGAYYRYFIIRACELCREVWWQEYDLGDAVADFVPKEPVISR